MVNNEEFYLDAFTSSSNWGPGEFEKFIQEINFTNDNPEDFFNQRAWQVWNAMTEEQKEDWATNYDYWLST